MSSVPVIEKSVVLSGASRAFAAVRAVDAVSLELARGSFTALVGPSGCGKTTLLRMIGGLEPVDQGAVRREPGPVSFCFQEPRLLPWRSVLENAALPLELSGVAPGERLARAHEALELVQLGDAATRLPSELSGGMRMRASLARALVARPSLLLLDEPFSALDEVTRQELDTALVALWQRVRFTAVVVTHSLPEAVFLSQRVVVFSPRPARVVADLRTPEVERDHTSWTSPEHNAVVREASAAMHAAIAEARR